MASLTAKKDPIRSSNLVTPAITHYFPQIHHQMATSSSPTLTSTPTTTATPLSSSSSSLTRPNGPSSLPPRADPIQHRPPPSVVTPVPPPRIPTQQQHLQHQQQHRPSTLLPRHQPQRTAAPPVATADRPTPRPDRNIDKVVLGDLCFRTWYPSYYGKELLGDVSATVKPAGGGGKDDTGKAASSSSKKEPPPMLGRLYVCPNCFKYSKEIVAWWGHIRVCELRGKIPGRKVYIHPQGRRTRYVPQGGKTLGQKRRRGDAGIRYIEETIQDEGEWSIWEVDGEVDRLFCQNLSLFGKLFLDNKSVFFDVTGFNYFLLVYTPPNKSNPSDGPLSTLSSSSSSSSSPTPPPQIVGFFSKEKMSWDNNNLACILVFPPWQRKGLGALLMGASYEISRREGVMGGPEKPISDLGKKGYKRFWAGEIARWLLSLRADNLTDQGTPSEILVDIKDCSEATWISPEDCLGVLREMGIVEDAGLGPGKPEKKPLDESGESDEQKQSANQQQQQQQQPLGEAAAVDVPAVKLVPRVRVNKAAVYQYVETHRISLERTCDSNGFVEGYAIKPDEGKEESEEQASDSMAE